MVRQLYSLLEVKLLQRHCLLMYVWEQLSHKPTQHDVSESQSISDAIGHM